MSFLQSSLTNLIINASIPPPYFRLVTQAPEPQLFPHQSMNYHLKHAQHSFHMICDYVRCVVVLCRNFFVGNGVQLSTC